MKFGGSSALAVSGAGSVERLSMSPGSKTLGVGVGGGVLGPDEVGTENVRAGWDGWVALGLGDGDDAAAPATMCMVVGH